MGYYRPYQTYYTIEIQPITGALADEEIKGNKVTMLASMTIGSK